jgi:hypothetical protein
VNVAEIRTNERAISCHSGTDYVPYGSSESIEIKIPNSHMPKFQPSTNFLSVLPVVLDKIARCTGSPR